MNTVTIYGHSDDCIEIESKVNTLADEFGAYNCVKFLHFDDGTIVKVGYDQDGYEGKWKAEVVALGPKSKVVSHTPAPNYDDYTDRLVIEGPFRCVDCFESETPTTGEYIDAIVDLIESNPRDCFAKATLEQLKMIHAILRSR